MRFVGIWARSVLSNPWVTLAFVLAFCCAMGCAASATAVTNFSKVVPADRSDEALAATTRRGRSNPKSIKRSQVHQPDEQKAVQMVQSAEPELPELPFDISEEDQVDFDESKLAVYKSWEWPDQEAPANLPLPPGRYDHERNNRRVLRFGRSARRHPRAFANLIGRELDETEKGET